jgi:undecaprenyl-diphosphatase
MSLIDMILLALIQGLTEFLPISSSGHLVLANALLGIGEPGIVTEVVLHLGTLAAVLIYFRLDLIRLAKGLLRLGKAAREEEGAATRRLLYAILAGTVPAVVAGMCCGALIESFFESTRVASIALLVTGAVLLSTLLLRRGAKQIGILRGVIIGLFQALALVPGISRSGMTISAGLYLGIDPAEAARFSFLLAVPAILGAAALKLPAMITHISSARGWHLLVGFAVSFVIGYLAIAVLLRIVRRGRFGWFGLYCLLVGLTGWIWLR